MAAKKFLFIVRKPPHGVGCAAEMLDAALMSAAFDQQVHLAFVDDGVLQLIKGQDPRAIGRQGLAEAFAQFADSDIDQVWVERESLIERGLGEDDLALAAIIVERTELAGLMAGMDVVVSA